MENAAYERLLSVCASECELNDSMHYLTEHMKPILKKGEAVLICFPRDNPASLGALLEKATLACGGVPVFWEKDLRWKELLRLSFVSHASTIIAPPVIVLGLSKLAKFESVPLYFYNVIMGGYPCLDWMMDGIVRGLDCQIWGILGPGTGPVISGFSCKCGRGTHIRDDKFKIEIEDAQGNIAPAGENGTVVVSLVDDPKTRFVTQSFGRIMREKCPCGDPSSKLTDINSGDDSPDSMLGLYEELSFWSSILDCRVERSEFGLELEIVCFPGEKMPKLPTCARLIVRAWNPEVDIPFSLDAFWTRP